jgi:hypothetical protein
LRMLALRLYIAFRLFVLGRLRTKSGIDHELRLQQANAVREGTKEIGAIVSRGRKSLAVASC